MNILIRFWCLCLALTFISPKCNSDQVERSLFDEIQRQGTLLHSSVVADPILSLLPDVAKSRRDQDADELEFLDAIDRETRRIKKESNYDDEDSLFNSVPFSGAEESSRESRPPDSPVPSPQRFKMSNSYGTRPPVRVKPSGKDPFSSDFSKDSDWRSTGSVSDKKNTEIFITFKDQRAPYIITSETLRNLFREEYEKEKAKGEKIPWNDDFPPLSMKAVSEEILRDSYGNIIADTKEKVTKKDYGGKKVKKSSMRKASTAQFDASETRPDLNPLPNFDNLPKPPAIPTITEQNAVIPPTPNVGTPPAPNVHTRYKAPSVQLATNQLVPPNQGYVSSSLQDANVHQVAVSQSYGVIPQVQSQSDERANQLRGYYRSQKYSLPPVQAPANPVAQGVPIRNYVAPTQVQSQSDNPTSQLQDQFHGQQYLLPIHAPSNPVVQGVPVKNHYNQNEKSQQGPTQEISQQDASFNVLSQYQQAGPSSVQQSASPARSNGYNHQQQQLNGRKKYSHYGTAKSESLKGPVGPQIYYFISPNIAPKPISVPADEQISDDLPKPPAIPTQEVTVAKPVPNKITRPQINVNEILKGESGSGFPYPAIVIYANGYNEHNIKKGHYKEKAVSQDEPAASDQSSSRPWKPIIATANDASMFNDPEWIAKFVMDSVNKLNNPANPVGPPNPNAGGTYHFHLYDRGIPAQNDPSPPSPPPPPPPIPVPQNGGRPSYNYGAPPPPSNPPNIRPSYYAPLGLPQDQSVQSHSGRPSYYPSQSPPEQDRPNRPNRPSYSYGPPPSPVGSFINFFKKPKFRRLLDGA